MRSKTQQRRLAAIVAADVVNYTRLTEKAEGSVHATLMSLRTNLIDPRIKHLDGRIVKNTGDGFLCEFGSILDATQFAIDVQIAIASRNAELIDETPILFRIGINVGDILVECDDIYGEGVNTAVRLESIADAGGIAVSESVYAAVKNRLPIKFEEMGLKKLKNIKEPARVYKITAVEGRKLGVKSRRINRGRMPVLAAMIALLAITSLFAIPPIFDRHYASTQSKNGNALPLPDKPSIAVLPFKNLSGNIKENYFIDGITEDLITYLSKYSRLFVISKNSSFQYKGVHRNIVQIGRELGVRYLIEGSVRKDGKYLRINTHLVDVETGHQLWSERYDSDLSNMFSLQDRIAQKVVAALAANLTSDDTGQNFAATGTKNLRAYDAYLQGWEFFRRWTPNDFKAAIARFKYAAKEDPEYAEAHAALAATYATAQLRWWHGDLGLPSSYAAEALARDALKKSMRRPTSLAYRVAARLYYSENRHSEALEQIDRAIALAPNDPENYWVKSTALIWAGLADKAISPLQMAMRLNPHYPPRYQAYLGIAKFAQNRFDEAAAELARANERRNDDAIALIHLAAAYGYLGRMEAAQQTLTRLNALHEELNQRPISLWKARQICPYKEAADQNRLLTGLRLAGVTDGNLTSAQLELRDAPTPIHR